MNEFRKFTLTDHEVRDAIGDAVVKLIPELSGIVMGVKISVDKNGDASAVIVVPADRQP